MSSNASLIEAETIGSVQKVAYTATAGRSTQLDPGRYYLVATTDAWVKLGGSGVTAITDDMPLYAATYWPLVIEAADKDKKDYVSVVQQSAGGSLYIIKVSR